MDKMRNIGDVVLFTNVIVLLNFFIITIIRINALIDGFSWYCIDEYCYIVAWLLVPLLNIGIIIRKKLVAKKRYQWYWVVIAFLLVFSCNFYLLYAGFRIFNYSATNFDIYLSLIIGSTVSLLYWMWVLFDEV